VPGTDGDRGIGSWAAPLDAPLPEPPDESLLMPIGADALTLLRTRVFAHARDAGLDSSASAAFVSAANEIATNSVRHGGGQALVRIWHDDGALVCDVKDKGHIENALVDREQPGDDVNASRGLWLANHMCDLVQIRSTAEGTTVRLHMWLGAPRDN
jgi:anti-sigma regulatory factor (Ser/Thr protein kinase)